MKDTYHRIFGHNRIIAVEPFEDREIKATVHSGFATINQKMTLTRLRVLAGNRDGTIPRGAYVYVSAEHFKSPWATKVFTFSDDVKFILMPEDTVLLVDQT